MDLAIIVMVSVQGDTGLTDERVIRIRSEAELIARILEITTWPEWLAITIIPGSDFSKFMKDATQKEVQ